MNDQERTKKLMCAIVFHKYGDPREVMEPDCNQEIPKPNKNEVLVKVECSSINAADRYMVRGNYLIVRLVLGLFKPAKKKKVLGMDIAGFIEAIGDEVKGIETGDTVVADMRKSFGGGFAEYAIVNAAHIVKKPEQVSFEKAATVPISGQAAMMGLIHCTIKPGDKILINGSSGGVGSFGVQLAKEQGANVTALCSAKKMNAVKRWGADKTIDYKKTSIKELPENEFDAVLDTASFGNPNDFSKTLKDNGRYVLVGGNFYTMLRLKLFGRWYGRSNQKFKSLTQDVEVTANIEKVLGMIVEGKINPAIQKTITLKEVPAAIHCLEQRTVIGKIIVNHTKE